MSDKMVPLDYVNNLVYELEKAFWDERGKGARFRLTNIGQQYFKDKVLPQIQSNEVEQILDVVGNVLKNDGLLEEFSYTIEERLLRVQIKGYIHLQVDEKMSEMGIEPLASVPGNLVALAIEEKLDVPVELAEIKVTEGVCELLLVMFEQRFELN
jgi:hypothetical protein